MCLLRGSGNATRCHTCSFKFSFPSPFFSFFFSFFVADYFQSHLKEAKHTCMGELPEGIILMIVSSEQILDPFGTLVLKTPCLQKQKIFNTSKCTERECHFMLFSDESPRHILL